MKCVDCKTEIEEILKDKTYTVKGKKIKGKAYICSKCGQSYTTTQGTTRLFIEFSKAAWHPPTPKGMGILGTEL